MRAAALGTGRLRATIFSLWETIAAVGVPDRHGPARNVVLGSKDLAPRAACAERLVAGTMPPVHLLHGG